MSPRIEKYFVYRLIKRKPNKAKNLSPHLARAEKGQTTTEYILVIAIAIMLAVAFFREFRPIFENVMDTLSGQMAQSLEENLYRFRL